MQAGDAQHGADLSATDMAEEPQFYRSPSYDMTQSSASSISLMSPVPDLTDTVSSLTEGYAAVAYDQSWASAPFYGNNGCIPSMSSGRTGSKNVYDDHVFDMKGSSPYLSDGQWGVNDQNAMHYKNVTHEGQQYNMRPPMADQTMFASATTEYLRDVLAGNAHFLDGNIYLRQHAFPNTDPGNPVSSAHARDLFQPPVEMINEHDMGPTPQRSPSPLMEVEGAAVKISPAASSEPDEPSSSRRPHRRASDTDSVKPNKTVTRRLSAHLPLEEKLLRAQATEGLDKQDKRRVQNKLAQRAFRARSKVANRNVFSRLEHLEELTERQADRIVKMNELVTRLQKENTGLKAQKFEQALQAQAASA